MNAELARRAAASLEVVRRKVAEEARRDPVVFLRFVMRDEQTGKPLDMAPMHSEWQDALTQHDRVLLWAAIESGKSSGISVGRVLWEIGNDPNLRVAVASATEGGAKKIVGTIARYIQHSPEYHLVFPHVRPSQRHGEAWTETRITVERSVQAKDPTVQAVGIRGHIHGARLDLVVADDLNDYANTATETQRDEVFTWVTSQLMNRLTSRARAWFLGNVWHRRDVMHRLEGTPGYWVGRYPAHSKKTGAFAWPGRYDQRWLAKKRTDLVTPSNINRMVYCELGEDGAGRVHWAWIQRGLDLGVGRRLAFQLSAIPLGYAIYTGVDIAVQSNDDNDLTAFVTVAVDAVKRRHLLWVESGKWSGPQIVTKLYEHRRRYVSPVFCVENNGAQDFILQFSRVDPRGPLAVKPYTTGTRKADPRFGIEAMGVEFAGGHWAIPNRGGHESYDNPELGELLSEFESYSPSKHTGDRLMALFFAREIAQQGWARVETTALDVTSR